MRQPKKQALAPLLSLQKRSLECTEIANLLKQAQTRLSLDLAINSCLPSSFKDQFKVNSLQNGVLVLTCSSAKLMTQFRMQQANYLNSLNALISPIHINSIQIKIRPFQIRTSKPKETLRTISKKNAQILLQEAEHTADQNLKNVLNSLASHAR